MGYTSEARAVYQKKYGHYCSACKQHNKTPVSYTEFKTMYLKHATVLRCVAHTGNTLTRDKLKELTQPQT